MNVSVTWYGHSNFQISCDGVSVLIDPFYAQPLRPGDMECGGQT